MTLLKMNYWLEFHSHQNWSLLKWQAVHCQNFHHHHHHQINQSLHTDHLHPLHPVSVDILDFWQTGLIRTMNFKIVLSLKLGVVKDYPQVNTNSFKACISDNLYPPSISITVKPLIGHCHINTDNLE